MNLPVVPAAAETAPDEIHVFVPATAIDPEVRFSTGQQVLLHDPDTGTQRIAVVEFNDGDVPLWCLHLSGTAPACRPRPTRPATPPC